MRRRSRVLLPLALAVLVRLATAQAAPDQVANAGGLPAQVGCLACHASGQIVVHRDGRELSGFVDQAMLDASQHLLLACVDCHIDVADLKLPEQPDPSEGVPPHPLDLARVNCGECHEPEAELHAASAHGQALAAGDALAPRCADCHGTHEVLQASDFDSPTAVLNIPATCGQCHREGAEIERFVDPDPLEAIENYSLTVHGEGLYQRGLSVTAVCTSCHTSHEILPLDDPRSSIHPDNITGVCTSCHGQIERVHKKVIEGRLWAEEPGKIPSCVDCHQPHTERKSFSPTGAASENCQTCHTSQTLAMQRDGQELSLYIDPHDFGASVHAEIACAKCHSDVQPSLERPCETATSAVDCSVCHAEVSDRYQGGLHGTLAAQGEAGAPGCVDCHTSHATLSKTDPASATFPVNVTALCSECHAEGQVADELNGDTPTEAVDSYLEGIHGRSLTKGGLLVTATCSSCHGSHQNLPADDPASSVALDNVAETCGSCHYGVTKQYRQSVHGIPAELVERSPSNPAPLGEDRRQASCKDCHRSHSIERSGTTAFRRELVSDCGACHEWHQSTFLWTTHGKATLLGGERAPSCDDCHGSHGIQPVSDQRSALHPDNIVATCAQCHEGSHEAFTSYRPHATPTQPKRWPLIFLVFWGMTGLLCATVLVTLTHSALFLYRLLKERGKWKAHHHKMSQPGADLRLYRRFNATTRNQHLVMVISFITLAMTGMTLKYAYTPWAGWVTRLLGGQARMSTLHLTSAVLLLGTFVWHVYTLFSNKKESGKSWLEIIKSPRSICFNGNDLKEVKATLSWFVGRGPRPVYNRFTYWEKFEYFAVCWGTFVIGSTGLAMWFPVQASYLISGWGLNIANLIHGFEALLAVASIFLVHFFNANLRPEKFPMDLTMFTGRMPVEELKFERMGEYQDLVDRGELEQHLVKPLPEGSERMIRVLASIALLTGLGLIGGIIYALLTY